MEDYELKKILKIGGKSQYVHLLKHKTTGQLIIKKKYNSHKPDHVAGFKNEIKILRHLNQKGCTFVPQLIKVIEDKFIIYMSFCGEIPKISNKTSEKIRAMMKILDKKYGIYRVNENNNKEYKVYFKNICKKDNKYYLIDFGASRWKMK